MDAPIDDLIRAVHINAVHVRATDDDNDDEPNSSMPLLYGHFARFNVWNEIDSWWEGKFMERLAAGAFKKTIRENGDNIKVLFGHGYDFSIGDKVLGPIEVLREEEQGPYYEVQLLDTSYNRDLVPGLEAGLYGASYRFRIVKEEWTDEPDLSPHNPQGLPERVIKEVRLYEFGPVTFPADTGATAAVRAVTDQHIERLVAMGRLPAHVLQLCTPPNGAAPTSIEPRQHSEPCAAVRQARLRKISSIILTGRPT